MAKGLTDGDEVASKVTIGNPDANLSDYFEQFSTKDLPIADFLGMDINGLVYSHPNIVSYQSFGKTISLRGLQVTTDNTVSILANE